MKLSMWMIADWLRKYDPVVKIKTGKPILRGARILSENSCLESQNVYLASADEFISNEKDKVICVQGHDMILLDTTDKESVLNDIFDAFDYYNSWYDGLINEIQEGCTLQHLVDASEHIFRNPILLFNASHIVTAFSQYIEQEMNDEWHTLITTRSHSLEIMQLLSEHIKNYRFTSTVHRVDYPFVDTTAVERMLFHNSSPQGRIIIMEYNGMLSEGKMQLLDVLGYLIEQWLGRNPGCELMQEDCEVFRDLLAQKVVAADTLKFKMTLNGWKEQDKKLLLKLEIPAESADITYPLLARLSHLFPTSYVFMDGRTIYILANLFHTEEQTLYQQLQWMQKQSNFFCGVSYPFTDIMNLHNADEQCSVALSFASGNSNGIYLCKNYVLNYIKNTLHMHLDASVVHPALDILRENDSQNHDELYGTLFTFLIHNCNIAHTARILNLHRNSLIYRLNKIKALTNIDLSDSNLRQHLYLSYLQEKNI